ncbi:hypothetical protein Pcinc_038270 [Petrolisthes cinctipes]|uniref:Ig-like domain-containing protein n=1 Tax=Petrolisthes cinctipes TaxID=88211 RepID=A0AAE1BRC5_PETCI|nr:hypothetical protein Pcinc_038270 [Petrolisthes cinctipes]
MCPGVCVCAYKCRVKLKVPRPPPHTVPPKLSIFTLRRDLTLGERLSVQCTVNGGDLPLLVAWTKDGISAEGVPGTKVQRLDRYSSILTVAHLTQQHSGNYTCTATNDAASISHTAPLFVNGNGGTGRCHDVVC